MSLYFCSNSFFCVSSSRNLFFKCSKAFSLSSLACLIRLRSSLRVVSNLLVSSKACWSRFLHSSFKSWCSVCSSLYVCCKELNLCIASMLSLSLSDFSLDARCWSSCFTAAFELFSSANDFSNLTLYSNITENGEQLHSN